MISSMRLPLCLVAILISAMLAGCGGPGGGGSAKELSRWTANYQPGQGRTSDIEIIELRAY